MSPCPSCIPPPAVPAAPDPVLLTAPAPAAAAVSAAEADKSTRSVAFMSAYLVDSSKIGRAQRCTSCVALFLLSGVSSLFLERNMTSLPSWLDLSCSLRSGNSRLMGSASRMPSTFVRTKTLGKLPSGIGFSHSLRTPSTPWSRYSAWYFLFVSCSYTMFISPSFAIQGFCSWLLFSSLSAAISIFVSRSMTISFTSSAVFSFFFFLFPPLMKMRSTPASSSSASSACGARRTSSSSSSEVSPSSPYFSFR
mmetsp:Transcript_6379/g.16616  ORF Transcript_6379/g.16616 Transcript_6379/m.16616 type:complete len:251 (-) Transcript_6379:393-1145(-)